MPVSFLTLFLTLPDLNLLTWFFIFEATVLNLSFLGNFACWFHFWPCFWPYLTLTLTYWPTFLFLRLQTWNFPFLGSFEGWFQFWLCFLHCLTLGMPYWPTFLLLKLQTWNLTILGTFACPFHFWPWFWPYLTLTYWPTFLKLQTWNFPFLGIFTGLISFLIMFLTLSDLGLDLLTYFFTFEATDLKLDFSSHFCLLISFLTLFLTFIDLDLHFWSYRHETFHFWVFLQAGFIFDHVFDIFWPWAWPTDFFTFESTDLKLDFFRHFCMLISFLILFFDLTWPWVTFLKLQTWNFPFLGIFAGWFHFWPCLWHSLTLNLTCWHTFYFWSYRPETWLFYSLLLAAFISDLVFDLHWPWPTFF